MSETPTIDFTGFGSPAPAAYPTPAHSRGVPRPGEPAPADSGGVLSQLFGWTPVGMVAQGFRQQRDAGHAAGRAARSVALDTATAGLNVASDVASTVGEVPWSDVLVPGLTLWNKPTPGVPGLKFGIATMGLAALAVLLVLKR